MFAKLVFFFALVAFVAAKPSLLEVSGYNNGYSTNGYPGYTAYNGYTSPVAYAYPEAYAGYASPAAYSGYPSYGYSYNNNYGW